LRGPGQLSGAPEKIAGFLFVGPTGDAVAREGDFVSLGGEFLPDDTAFVVCGPFTVTPAG
jgi:hypothetical protein